MFCDVAVATATVLLAPHWLRHFLGHADIVSAATASALIASVFLSAFAIRHSLFALVIPDKGNKPVPAETIASLSGMAALIVIGRGSGFFPWLGEEWCLEGGSLAIFVSRLIRMAPALALDARASRPKRPVDLQ